MLWLGVYLLIGVLVATMTGADGFEFVGLMVVWPVLIGTLVLMTIIIFPITWSYLLITWLKKKYKRYIFERRS